MEYEVELVGCDDTTAFNLVLTQEQLEVVKLLEIKSKETSTYGCMPTLEVREVK